MAIFSPFLPFAVIVTARADTFSGIKLSVDVEMFSDFVSKLMSKEASSAL